MQGQIPTKTSIYTTSSEARGTRADTRDGFPDLAISRFGDFDALQADEVRRLRLSDLAI
jgi:hypothetical protein